MSVFIVKNYILYTLTIDADINYCYIEYTTKSYITIIILTGSTNLK